MTVATQEAEAAIKAEVDDGAEAPRPRVRNVAGIARALDILIEWKLEQLAAAQRPEQESAAGAADESRKLVTVSLQAEAAS
jgi:hypothetical protein